MHLLTNRLRIALHALGISAQKQFSPSMSSYALIPIMWGLPFSRKIYFRRPNSRSQLLPTVNFKPVSCTSASNGSAFRKQTELFWQYTNQQWFGSCKHSYVAAKVSAKVSSARSTAFQNLCHCSIVNFTDFWSRLSIIYAPELSIKILKAVLLWMDMWYNVHRVYPPRVISSNFP